jgi:hypothetical protein
VLGVSDKQSSLEPVRTAIRLSLDYVSKASTHDAAASGALDFLLWKATSEVEYAAFRIAMTNRLEDYHFKIKSASGAESSRSFLTEARKMIEEAETLLDSDPKVAYTNLRTAMVCLRRAQTSGLGTRSGKGPATK